MHKWLVMITAWVVVTTASGWAWAGVPECNDLRLQDVSSCELRGELDCQVGCEELGVYKKACATKLHTVCREDCVLDPEPTCTDECTETCTADCDAGVNVICIHNCFGECAGSCQLDCESATDPQQCLATCEANCDGECDIKCRPLVDGDCYKHCIECCGGSCTAQANMTCQQTCQEEEFEDCEYELRADCDASCMGDGALFCDGEYVLSGSQLPSCAQALLAQGISVANFEAELEGEASGSTASLGSCSMTPARSFGGLGAVLAGMLLLVLCGVRRSSSAPLRVRHRSRARR